MDWGIGKWIRGWILSQMRTMVLEDLPTKLGHMNGVNVGKCSSTMEHMGKDHISQHSDPLQGLIGI